MTSPVTRDVGAESAEGREADRSEETESLREAQPSPPPSAPLIGKPTPPPPALAVAVSERFTAPVRSARRMRLVLSALGIAGVMVGAVALAAVTDRLAGVGRTMALAEALVLGGLLAVGSVLRRRPLELGAGVIARGAQGGLALGPSLMGIFLCVSSLFREAAEGAVFGLGLVQPDPAAELAAWIALALSKPHGPGPGEWVSLEGVNAAGLFSLPEDLKAALAALRGRGAIEVDVSRYPPLVRLRDGAGDVIAGK